MQVENGIPMPTPKKQKKYPFSEMSPGQSVFIEGQNIKGNAYKKALQIGAKKGWKFSGRTVEGGVRIWRTE